MGGVYWELVSRRKRNLNNSIMSCKQVVWSPGSAAPERHCGRAAHSMCIGQNGVPDRVPHLRVSSSSRFFARRGCRRVSDRGFSSSYGACMTSTMGPMVFVPEWGESPRPWDSSEKVNQRQTGGNGACEHPWVLVACTSQRSVLPLSV